MSIPIVPSILAADQTQLELELERIGRAADRIHVDVMDGHFVPNLYGGLDLLRQLRVATRLELDCHLAIADPDDRAIHFVEAGADGVAIHLEAARDPVSIAEGVRAAGGQVSLALCPWTPVEAARPYLSAFDRLLLVTVTPGFGGQRMRADAPSRIAATRQILRDQPVEIRLEVDGGVDVTTIERCRDAGADSFVAGTAVFATEDPVEAIGRLHRLAAPDGSTHPRPSASRAVHPGDGLS